MALTFSAGLILGISALGLAASLLGRLVARWSYLFAALTAIFSVLAGLAAILAPRLKSFFPGPEGMNRQGIVGSFVYGLIFTIATVTTGAGPLFLLLTIAAAIGRPAYGAALSFAYGVGKAIPFLLLALFAGKVASWLARMEGARRTAEIVSGVALIVIGFYFAWLAKTLAS